MPSLSNGNTTGALGEIGVSHKWNAVAMHSHASSTKLLVTRVQCLNIIMSMLHVICSYFARTGKIKSLIVYFWIKCAIVMYLSIYLSNCVAASTLDSVVIMQCNECEHCAFDSKSSYRLNFNVNGHYNTYIYIWFCICSANFQT